MFTRKRRPYLRKFLSPCFFLIAAKTLRFPAVNWSLKWLLLTRRGYSTLVQLPRREKVNKNKAYLNNTHRIDNSQFCFGRANDVKRRQKVWSYSNQRIFRPAAKPVHCATAEQPRELQRTIAELLSHLEMIMRFEELKVSSSAKVALAGNRRKFMEGS